MTRTCTAAYAPLPVYDIDDETQDQEPQELDVAYDEPVQSDKATELRRIVEECELRESKAKESWAFWEKQWERHRAPIQAELDDLEKTKQDAMSSLTAELELARKLANPPAGPEALRFVESDWFGTACNIVVALNLAQMGFSERVEHLIGKSSKELLNHLFLVWYVLELIVKVVYYRRAFLIGPITIVWWSWMDLLIVVSGTVEQWVVPLLTVTGMPGVKLNLSALRALRFLRLLRVLRVLKLVRVFVQGDFSWVQGTTYECIGTIILGVNSLTMAIELDVPEWPMWPYLNSLFLAYYSFDIACRIKFQGCAFFYDRDTLGWNLLDFIIVIEGVVDQWVLPLVKVARAAITGEEASNKERGNQLGILKILRLLRILRLARLCRSIPPLYKLMQGVAEALGGLRWVMVLTMLVLYSGAIVFTTMVSQALIGTEDEDEETSKENFGSVPRSLYSLFRIMNGDLDVAEGVSTAIAGRLMLVGFIICSNWAILAILTSVVSDNMISSSASIAKEEEKKAEADRLSQSKLELEKLFKQIDSDGSNEIDEDEWSHKVTRDPHMRKSLCDLALMDDADLGDAFDAVARTSKDGAMKRHIHFEEFVNYLVKDSRVPADKRSVLKIRQQLEALEASHLQTRSQIDMLAGKIDLLTCSLDKSHQRWESYR